MKKLKKFFKIQKLKGKFRPISGDLVSIRVGKDGTLGAAEPCSHCISVWSSQRFINIKYVHYSNFDGTIVSIKFMDLLKKPHKKSSGYINRKK